MIHPRPQPTLLRAVLSRSLSLWLAFFAIPAWAHITECEKALKTVQAVLGEALETEVYDDEAKSRENSLPTVKVVSVRAGLHGGKRILLSRTGTRWLSDHRTVDYDPQGDPRWFIETMGSEAAEFFGFRLLSDSQVEVPDGDEFSGALVKINARLREMGKDPIENTFYVTTGEGNNKVADYVRAYGQNGALPLASGGNHLIHDLSFHTGAIFFPAEIVRLSKYFARFLDGYLEFLTRKYAARPDKAAAIKHLALLMRMNHTIALDTATATVNPGIVAGLRRPGDRDAQAMLFAPTVLLSGQGQTARMYFAAKLEALDPRRQEYINEYYGVIKIKPGSMSQSARTALALEQVSLVQLIDDFDEFAGLKLVEGHERYDRRFIPQEEEVIESLCKGIGVRRLAIRQAALALMGKN